MSDKDIDLWHGREGNTIGFFVLFLTEKSGEKGVASCAIMHLLHRHMIMIHSPFSSVKERTKNPIVLPPSRTRLPCLVLYTRSIYTMSIV